LSRGYVSLGHNPAVVSQADITSHSIIYAWCGYAARVGSINTFSFPFLAAILYRLILSQLGKRPKPNSGSKHWRFQCGFQVLDTLLSFETAVHQSWAKIRPNLKIFTPPL